MKPHNTIFHTVFSVSSTKLFLLFYLLCVVFSPVFSANSDLQQLLSFKSSVLDKTELPNWSSTTNLCDFSGVTCNINSRVVSIDLSSKKLHLDFQKVSSFLLILPNLDTLLLKNSNITGKFSLSPRSQCSSVLTKLDLAENTIYGPVSGVSTLSSCIKLKSLNLSGNLMEFPASDSKGLSLSLESLDLSYNKIVGPNFMPWLLSGGCSELKFLSIKGNKIAGPVVHIQDCKNLQFLDLSANNFSVGVPKFDDFLVLNHLDLSLNKFSGDISGSIASCKNLTFLNITHNQFGGGEIPFIPSGNIKFLYLSGNDFKGAVPDHLSDLCPSLVELDVSANSLFGSVPEGFGACSSLEVFDISHNNFSGKLPIDTLLKLSSLKNMMFGFNNFVGDLSDSFSKMIKLETFDVSSNKLSGVIPVGICQDPRNSLRVLYLQNNELIGPIPESLSDCSNLVSLDLSFNYLNGTIPASLGSLSNLRDLILWLNQLDGEIPEELMNIKTLENLILDFNDLTGSIPASLSNCTSLNWISLSNNQLSGEIPASFGQLTNLAILKLGNNSLTGNIPPELGDCRSLIWMDLNTNLLNGTIPPSLFKQSGNIAAGLLTEKPYGYIKNVIHVSGQGDREFTAEMETIGKVKHRNLVPLLGYCKVGDERLLVYEYMKFGSLEDVLHDRKKIGIKLNWAARRKIAIGAARGLAFLHHSCDPHIIHRDMKSSNVLLDENLEARVSDFGMAREMNPLDTHLSVSTLAGTPGYVPPEYYQSFKCTTKGDVYSYGVVLLELLTGKQPTDSPDFGDNNLVGWVKQHTKLKIIDVFDPQLLKEDPSLMIELLEHLKIACACLDDRQWKRPTMIQVMAMFKEIQAGSGFDSLSTIGADDHVNFGAVEGVEMSIKEDVEMGHHD
ncbi:hypothetical protein AgCh_026410 [Apium graveolens]